MGTIDDLFKEFPPSVQKYLQSAWGQVSDEQRVEMNHTLEAFLPLIEGKIKVARRILDLLEMHYAPLLFTKRKIVIIGPVNVGKTSLFNQFMLSREEKGKVSAVPGTTRENHSAGCGAWDIIDTPGADHGTNVGDEERAKAMAAASQADFLIVVFDATRGVTASCEELYREVLALDKPHVLALNKIDMVRKDLGGVLAEAARTLGVGEEQIIPVSAARGEKIDRLAAAIVKTDAGVLHSLGEIMPKYRHMLARQWILSAAGSAGVIGLTPLPLVDLIPLTALQGALVLNLAGIYGYKITLSRAKELVMTFGAGIAARTLFEQLSKLGGVPGWILAAAIAASTTAAIGFAAEKWFEKGEKATAAKISELARKLSGEIIPRLKSIGKKRPGKKKIEGAITEILDELEGHTQAHD
jgi:GTPase